MIDYIKKNKTIGLFNVHSNEPYNAAVFYYTNVSHRLSIPTALFHTLTCMNEQIHISKVISSICWPQHGAKKYSATRSMSS